MSNLRKNDCGDWRPIKKRRINYPVIVEFIYHSGTQMLLSSYLKVKTQAGDKMGNRK